MGSTSHDRDGARLGRGTKAFLLAGALGAILAALLFLGYLPKRQAMKAAEAEASRDPRPAVLFMPIRRAAANADLSFPASLEALKETTIYARSSGYVRRWQADIGDRVRQGQVLAEIDTPEIDREIEQALASRAQIAANLELARVTAERYRNLLKSEAVSPQEVDEKQSMYEARKADHAAANANLRRLQQMRSFLRVTAPFSGTITARNVEVGSLVQAGSASSSGWLFKLVHAETIRIHAMHPAVRHALGTPRRQCGSLRSRTR